VGYLASNEKELHKYHVHRANFFMMIDPEHSHNFCTKISLCILKITNKATVENLGSCPKFNLNHICRLIIRTNTDKRKADLYN
jgi:hypothetical protein